MFVNDYLQFQFSRPKIKLSLRVSVFVRASPSCPSAWGWAKSSASQISLRPSAPRHWVSSQFVTPPITNLLIHANIDSDIDAGKSPRLALLVQLAATHNIIAARILAFAEFYAVMCVKCLH